MGREPVPDPVVVDGADAALRRTGPGLHRTLLDRVLANRFIYRFKDPERGDVVVFETPRPRGTTAARGGTFVKRIVGLRGRAVEMRRGAVFIDGRRLREPYVSRSNPTSTRFRPKRSPWATTS